MYSRGPVLYLRLIAGLVRMKVLELWVSGQRTARNSGFRTSESLSGILPAFRDRSSDPSCYLGTMDSLRKKASAQSALKW